MNSTAAASAGSAATVTLTQEALQEMIRSAVAAKTAQSFQFGGHPYVV